MTKQSTLGFAVKVTMRVYIELAIINNFALTTLICMSTMRFMRQSVKKRRVFVVSTLATVAAVLLPLVRMHFIVLTLAKALLGIVLSLVLLFPHKRRAAAAAVFFGCTFVFGGCLSALEYALSVSIFSATTLPMSGLASLVIIAAGFAVFAVVRKITVFSRRRADSAAFECDAEVTVLGKTAMLRGFIDSGNRLYDEKSGLPVAVIGLNALDKLFDASTQIKLLCKENPFGARYINASSINGGAGMLVLKADSIKLYYQNKPNILNDVMVGLSKKNLCFDILLHPFVLADDFNKECA